MNLDVIRDLVIIISYSVQLKGRSHLVYLCAV